MSWAQRPLNDAEIAEVMEVCQKVRVDFASVALQKAESDELKDFASYTISNYEEEQSPIAIFLKGQNQSASDIEREIQDVSRKLKKYKGKEFDEQFLETQMDIHKRILKDFKETLIPAAKDPELKKSLNKVYAELDDYVGGALDTYISIKK